MADDWFAGEDGSDANSGETWPLRKLTITGLLAVAFAAGDRLIVGPGVYRELVTLPADVAPFTYVVGTVDVTNESTAVTGNGTGFLAAGVAAGDQLFIGNFITGANGAFGAGQFTSVGANFQAGMVGYMIEVMTQGAYIIASVINPTTITLTDVNVVGLPGAGPYTYYVVSGEGPHEIAGDITATTLTLVKTWSGPTLTAIPYIIYRPVYLIADTTGVETDGVGGVVRITGTDDDETKTRDYGIYAVTRNYWIIRGFRVDCCNSRNFWIEECTYMTFEDMSVMDYETHGFEFYNCDTITVRRTVILGGAPSAGYSINFNNDVNDDNAQNLLENLYITGGARNINITDCGGSTIKNYTSGFRSYWNIYAGSTNVGAAVFVHDCLLHFTSYEALEAGVLGELVEQYNNFWSNGVDRDAATVGTAANSTAYPYLPALPLLTGRGKNPMVSFFAPSQWEPTRNAAGLYGKNEDLFGVYSGAAQTRRSWGAMLNYATVRSEEQFQGTFTGSLYMENAMEQQFVFPVREDWDYTVTVQVYLETNYVGDPPQVTVKQPGVAPATVTSVGGIGSWEQLSVEFTTGPAMDWINVSLRSRNTSVLANVGCYWQDLAVN